MTHSNNASKSSLHTKIWLNYIIVQPDCLPIFSALYILSRLGLYLKVSIPTPTPSQPNPNPNPNPFPNQIHVSYVIVTHWKILDFLHCIYPFIFKDQYYKEYIFLKINVLSVNACFWRTSTFFCKISQRTRRQAGRHCVLTLLDVFSRKQTRLPNPSAARQTRSVVSLSLVDVTQLRQNMSSYKTMAKHVISYILLPMLFLFIAYTAHFWIISIKYCI